ncbi:MAG TPA: ankyrin repeat domain-containing protein [Candidatus Rifleibacterium sp.]|nr:ankyrin repeat domain-containing protein [Candidatus Rifleibacterium sp.]HPW58887.1 ankyrin repeat domain-containing protein [Candidatus Rifleibacterium sp.]
MMKRTLCVILFGIFMIYWPGIVASSEADGKTNGMAMIKLFEARENKTTVDEVKKLLKNEIDFNCTDMYGYPVLACAINCTNNPEIVDTLIKAGADVNAIGALNKHTVLHIAAICDASPAIMSMLLKAGADVNARNSFGSTPLFYSFLSPENMQILINAGADVNARDTLGNTPLLDGAMLPYTLAFVEILVKAGANINERDSRHGRTAFLLAAACNENPEMLTELVRLGADIHARDSLGLDALMNAANFGNTPEVIRRLIEMGIDVNATTETGKTALIYAATEGHSNTVATLIGLGANIGSKDQDGRNALLNAAIKSSFSSLFIKIAASLVEAGANINETDNFGKSALYYAAEANELDAMEALVKEGADAGIRLENGRSVLMQSLNHWRYFSRECMDCILATGVDINARDNEGKTALMWTVGICHGKRNKESREYFEYAVNRLLKAGADKTIKDNFGKTAFDYAKEQEELADTDACRQLDPNI